MSQNHELEGSSGNNDSLEDLFDEVIRLTPPGASKLKAKTSTRVSLEAVIARQKELYTNPENWQRTRGIALIHSETQSLIGNYSEYKHKTVLGCRKLILEPGIMQVDTTEMIAGWEMLGEPTREHLHAAERWTAEREIIFNLVLEPLGVHADAVRLKVCLSFGGIVRVELQDETQLISPTGDILITLPSGVNVLEVMSLDAKVNLRRELQS